MFNQEDTMVEEAQARMVRVMRQWLALSIFGGPRYARKGND